MKYDVIISINVHENFIFLLKQLDNIKRHVHCTYAVLLNCNDYMFQKCKKINLPHVYIHPISLNKQRFHGSITNGICNNMQYALTNFIFKFLLWHQVGICLNILR